MNVYDFDGTIYDGDSSLHFYLHCLRIYPRIVRRWPSVVAGALRLAARRIDLIAFKQIFFAFVRDIPDINAALSAFWATHAARIKPWYREQRTADDVIISASPEFLLRPVCACKLIASRVDPLTGRFEGANCRGEEKIRRFEAIYPLDSIDEFYSDSHADDPMARVSKKAFFVKGDAIQPWPLDPSNARHSK